MKIWKLTVVNPESDNWRGCSYRKDVIVRAATEYQARMLAGKIKFSGEAIKKLGTAPIGNPWLKPEDTACTVLQDSGHPDEGPEKVLYPQMPGH